MESLLNTGACRTDLPFFSSLEPTSSSRQNLTGGPDFLKVINIGAANAYPVVAVERIRSESRNDLGTLQTLVMFCPIGQVLSTFLAANGWICPAAA
jgi:hypothetical protein